MGVEQVSLEPQAHLQARACLFRRVRGFGVLGFGAWGFGFRFRRVRGLGIRV